MPRKLFITFSYFAFIFFLFLEVYNAPGFQYLNSYVNDARSNVNKPIYIDVKTLPRFDITKEVTSVNRSKSFNVTTLPRSNIAREVATVNRSATYSNVTALPRFNITKIVSVNRSKYFNVTALQRFNITKETHQLFYYHKHVEYVQKEAVVFTTRVISECEAGRLASLVATSKRDVWLLHDHDSFLIPKEDLIVRRSEEFIKQIPGLNYEQQIKKHTSFDSEISSTKSAFLRWYKNHSEYTSAWLVEDDVFYTGAWYKFFNDMMKYPADVIAVYYDNNEKQWWKDKSCTIKGELCREISPKHTYWMTIRISRNAALDLLSHIEDGTIKGHHEAITAAFMNKFNYSMKFPDRNFVGVKFVPAHWGPWMNKYNQTLERMKPEANKLYHPVKCVADDGLGEKAIYYSYKRL
uniref:Uncharacterized protein n=1 Tax=Aplanochytrium stocchinoi TaxID=215587 RepID=A0A7S3LP27_9STRA